MRPIALALLLLLSGACATVKHGRYEAVPVDSNPEGARVGVDCGDAPRHAAERTPTVISIPRAAERCTVTFLKEGYRPATVTLKRQIARETVKNFRGAGVGIGMLDADCCNDDLWVALSLGTLVGGVIYGGFGVAIDHATGAMYEHVPGEVAVALEPDDAEEFEEP